MHLLAAVAEELLQQEDLLVLQQADQVELEELYLLADHLKLHQVVAVEEGIQALELLDQVVQQNHSNSSPSASPATPVEVMFQIQGLLLSPI